MDGTPAGAPLSLRRRGGAMEDGFVRVRLGDKDREGLLLGCKVIK